MQPIVLRFKVDMLAVILKKARTCYFPSCRVQKGWPMLLQGSRNDPQSFYGMYSMARNDGHFSLSQIRTESSFKFSSSSAGFFLIALLSHFLSSTSKQVGFSPKNDTLFLGWPKWLKSLGTAGTCFAVRFSHPFYLHEIKN